MVASDAYALRWCLFHMKRSSARARPSRSPVPRTCGNSGGRRCWCFAGDLDVLEVRDAGSAIRWCCHGILSLGIAARRAVVAAAGARADAQSSPAARRLADDSKQVAASCRSQVRSMGLTAAGGAERIFEVRVDQLGDVRGSGDGRAAGCLW